MQHTRQATLEFIKIFRPEVIKRYNNGIGGVDFFLCIYLLRQALENGQITHDIDLALVNAWLEYKKQAIELAIPKSKILDLLAFR